MKILLRIMVIFGCVSTLYGQEYYPFPESNAIWNQYRVHVEHPQLLQGITRYGLIGDTIINDKLYSKVYDIEDDSCLNINNATYFGAIREEEKKIYALIAYGQEEEILLYDFNVEVGDTVISNAQVGYLSGLTYISGIDSISLPDGTTRKRYWIDNSMDEYWIEGIGSQAGPFTPIQDQITNYYSPHLTCFKQNDQTIYLSNYSCDKCFCQLATGLLEAEDHPLSIYPNPSTGMLMLETVSECCQIIIYDCKGQVIRMCSSTGNVTTVNLCSMPSGLYLLQLRGEGWNRIEKVVLKR